MKWLLSGKSVSVLGDGSLPTSRIFHPLFPHLPVPLMKRKAELI